MNTKHKIITVAAIAAVSAVSVVAQESAKPGAEKVSAACPPAPAEDVLARPRVTSLTSTALLATRVIPSDPTRETVLIGRTRVEDMIIQLEIEPAKAMWVVTGSPAKPSEQAVEEGGLYHVKVTPIDPRSKSRIPYASVKFEAANKDNGRVVDSELRPMWGSSGLHYAFNTQLEEDGTYETKVIVGVPTFARSPKYRGRWAQPVAAKFHFRLADGKLAVASDLGTN